jgi:hypothetical protein
MQLTTLGYLKSGKDLKCYEFLLAAGIVGGARGRSGSSKKRQASIKRFRWKG